MNTIPLKCCVHRQSALVEISFFTRTSLSIQCKEETRVLKKGIFYRALDWVHSQVGQGEVQRAQQHMVGVGGRPASLPSHLEHLPLSLFKAQMRPKCQGDKGK